MSRRLRVVVFLAAATVVVTGTAVYGIVAYQRHQDRLADPPGSARADYDRIDREPHIVFRNTSLDNSYGLVAIVPLAQPGGPRAVTDVACDRVDATASEAICLRTKRGVVTRFEADVYGADWKVVDHWSLPGVPSRARLSPSGQLGASTSFVTGHSYMQSGFSTATTIHRIGGDSYGNLEDFALTVDGHAVTAKDRNLWGVTFASDDNTFYATAAFGGQTWLVRGDLAARSLVGVVEGAECPSLAPGGELVAYKKNVAGGSTPHWSIAVYDLRSGRETVLAEKDSVDDQVEWLDDDTLLYGKPRDDEPGVSDVWSIDVHKRAAPHRLIAQAWSPSVVR